MVLILATLLPALATEALHSVLNGTTSCVGYCFRAEEKNRFLGKKQNTQIKLL